MKFENWKWKISISIVNIFIAFIFLGILNYENALTNIFSFKDFLVQFTYFVIIVSSAVAFFIMRPVNKKWLFYCFHLIITTLLAFILWPLFYLLLGMIMR